MLPEVQVQKPEVMWSKDLLIARINAYIKRHGDLLAPYVGTGKKAHADYLAAMASMSQEEVEHAYKQLRSLVNFDGQTKFCMVGAYAMSTGVEGVTRATGLKTGGMTQDVFGNEKMREQVEECCEDFVMEHSPWFTKTNRAEVRFAQILFEAAKTRHLDAMAQAELEAPDPQLMEEDEEMDEPKSPFDADEGVIESKPGMRW